MRIVDEYPNREVKVAAVIYPLGPKPVPAVVEDEEEVVAQAKVVRTPNRKTPRATVEGVTAK